jgi:hypothetical protein
VAPKKQTVSRGLPQLGILLVREEYIFASTPARPDAIIKPLESAVLWGAADKECAETVQCLKRHIARLGANRGVAVTFDEVYLPSPVEKFKIDEDAVLSRCSKPQPRPVGYSFQVVRLSDAAPACAGHTGV